MKLKRISLPFAGYGIKKYVRIMKLTWFLILALTLQTSASLWSQTTSMSIKLKNTSLLELFMHIEKNSEYRFFYNNDDVDVGQKVSVNAENMAIGDILKEVFKGLPYSFRELHNNMILVESKSNHVRTDSFLQQKKPVSGKVTDKSNQPLPGVTILIKGTTQGVVTDSDGNYSLPSVPIDATLVFSFVGMKTQEVPVAGRSSIDITMQEETIGIEEVVAIGYGTIKKADLTGAVSVIKPDEFKNITALSVGNAMQGLVPGVNIRSSGNIGSEPVVEIRGLGNFTNNNPLY
ncbi:MAG: TonB-dependent receptor plug domain-containing protein, partial [Chlorobi bacterium]|nr:TonB-dependent receptor plug domain-containing protein [Chlorobiota bacterium]